MDFDVNDPDQLPDADWFANPPDWFVYFVNRLEAAGAPRVEIEDVLEKISPYGMVPGWYQ